MFVGGGGGGDGIIQFNCNIRPGWLVVITEIRTGWDRPEVKGGMEGQSNRQETI